MTPTRVTRIISLLALLLTTPALAADWPSFRGPDRNGVSPDPHPPLHWSATENVKWKADLPTPGNGSPIVSANRVFVAAAADRTGKRRGLFCFDRADGKLLWSKFVPYEPNDPTHATNPYCASTPAADGRRVVVWHGAAGLHCYDYDGNVLWSRDLGPVRHIWGYASSPLIYGDSIILNVGPGDRQFVTALDRRTGATLWQTDEPGGAADKSPQTHNWIGSWSSPILAKLAGRDAILLAMPRHVNAYDPATGKVLWTCPGTGDLAYSDVLIAGARGLATAGYGGAAIGFDLPSATADAPIPPTAEPLWRDAGSNPQRIGSGVIVGDFAYLPNEPGISCVELATGKERWRHRPPGATFWSGLILAGGRAYATTQRGTTLVFTPDPTAFRPLATNPLDDPTNATPASADGQLVFRTAAHLWCIEER